MRKTLIIPLTIITITLTFSSIFFLPIVRGATWGVSPSDSYDFELNNINLCFDLGPYSYEAAEIAFGGAFVEENSTITMIIVSTTESSINYNLTCGGLAETHTLMNETFEDRLKNLMLLPLKFTDNELQLEDLQRGFTGIDYLIVPTLNSTWDQFDLFDNQFYLQIIENYFESYAILDLQAKTVLNWDIDECVFDWFVNASYSDVPSNTYYDFLFNLKIAYEISTGLLFGMRVDAAIQGQNASQPANAIVQSEIVREGYTLGDFVLPGEEPDLSELFSALIPSYEWFIVLATLLLSSGIWLIFRKKRK